MELPKAPRHLGQSIALGFVQVLMSVGVIALMMIQTNP